MTVMFRNKAIELNIRNTSTTWLEHIHGMTETHSQDNRNTSVTQLEHINNKTGTNQ